MKREYSSLHNNLQVDYRGFNLKTTAVIAAISHRQGLVAWKDYNKAVKIPDFVDFIQLLNQKVNAKSWSMFMDNLSVHRSKAVRNELERINVTPIYNVVYSPEYNPIEMSFAIVKQRFRALKTNDIINNSSQKTIDLIKAGFNSIDPGITRKHIDHCERLIQHRA